MGASARSIAWARAGWRTRPLAEWQFRAKEGYRCNVSLLSRVLLSFHLRRTWPARLTVRVLHRPYLGTNTGRAEPADQSTLVAPRASRPGLLTPLRHRDYRLLMEAYSVSAAGSWAYYVGLVVFVFEQTHSAAWVSAVALSRFVPPILFGSYGGVLSERFERTRLMVRLDLGCAALMGGLAVLAAYHGPALAAIAISAVNSLFVMPYKPAVAAMTPQLVSEDELAAANALYSTVSKLAMIAGPALGALLLVVGDLAFVFAANALSFLWSAVVVSRISARSTPGRRYCR
jgi:predicted MFS family arabinose efflux permease